MDVRYVFFEVRTGL